MGKKVIQKSEDLTNKRNGKADRGKAGSGKATQADKNRTKEIRGQSGNKKAATRNWLSKRFMNWWRMVCTVMNCMRICRMKLGCCFD